MDKIRGQIVIRDSIPARPTFEHVSRLHVSIVSPDPGCTSETWLSLECTNFMGEGLKKESES